ncbi:type II toxin-antitoxin system ParD family antitoxin [Hyphomonas sp. WL0036]|uniref:type II toxin-antitoxin system ParD family antitoxin n=1 Tax=Hyphomonas sediminis TaxID=2866160 RepID=UPI001C818CBB|nr:type II toxin-antitoxin system ParD family antitoxin [Hyphomonas sediminis]MBY9066676.1 type II toxin-antitoxin system ParD family antitoxin [Hyphomonas sediminis]
MATMNISLPDQMKAWVEAQAEDGKYANSSDVIRDLIRREQIKQEKIAALNVLLEEGEASGFVEISAEDLLESVRAQAKT